MVDLLHRGIMRWFIDNLLWDTRGPAREGLWGVLWATRKLLAAVAGSALLTWGEWVEHHPRNIVLPALIHFVFVLAVIALAGQVGRWLGRRDKKPSSGQPKGPTSE